MDAASRKARPGLAPERISLIRYPTAPSYSLSLPSRVLKNNRPPRRNSMGERRFRCADSESVVVAPGGVEPPARGLGNRCSIRLSYGA